MFPTARRTCITTSTSHTPCALSKGRLRCDTTLLEQRGRSRICFVCKHLWFPPAPLLATKSCYLADNFIKLIMSLHHPSTPQLLAYNKSSIHSLPSLTAKQNKTPRDSNPRVFFPARRKRNVTQLVYRRQSKADISTLHTINSANWARSCLLHNYTTRLLW